MRKLIFSTNSTMIPSSFEIGHSIFKIKDLENQTLIEFQGTYYMELPRTFNGLEIWSLSKQEEIELINNKPSLSYNKMNFYKILSNNETYYIGALQLILPPPTNGSRIPSCTF